MQVKNSKKQLVLDALAKVVKELRGSKSQFMLASDNDISVSIISMVERGLKDPQFTTLLKLSEALNIEPVEFLNKIICNLPDNFSMIDK